MLAEHKVVHNEIPLQMTFHMNLRERNLEEGALVWPKQGEELLPIGKPLHHTVPFGGGTGTNVCFHLAPKHIGILLIHSSAQLVR